MLYNCKLEVLPIAGVRDPQADAVQQSIERLGGDDVLIKGVGRLLSCQVRATSETEARTRIAGLCESLLINPILETYILTLSAVAE